MTTEYGHTSANPSVQYNNFKNMEYQGTIPNLDKGTELKYTQGGIIKSYKNSLNRIKPQSSLYKYNRRKGLKNMRKEGKNSH